MARVPKLMSLLLLLPNPCPQTSVLPPAIQSDPFKRQIWFYSFSLQRAESHSEWKPESLQRPTGLTQSDLRFPLVSYFISTALCSQLSWPLGFPPTCPYPPASKVLQGPFPLWNTLPAEGAWMTLSFPSHLGLKCRLFPGSLPWLSLAKTATVSCSLSSLSAFSLQSPTPFDRAYILFIIWDPPVECKLREGGDIYV